MDKSEVAEVASCAEGLSLCMKMPDIIFIYLTTVSPNMYQDNSMGAVDG